VAKLGPWEQDRHCHRQAGHHVSCRALPSDPASLLAVYASDHLLEYIPALLLVGFHRSSASCIYGNMPSCLYSQTLLWSHLPCTLTVCHHLPGNWYAMDTLLHELLISSEHRTFDPSEADYFYVSG
jgi:hypothetical protein